MVRLDISLLGTPSLAHNSQMVALPTRKSLALLAYLVTEGSVQPRDKLTALFWPDSDPEKARATLRSTLAFLRKALGDHLIADRTVVGFDFRSDFSLDLHALQAAYTLATASSVGSVESDVRAGVPARLQAACDLYRGDFMDGFSLANAPEFETWLVLEREAWRRRLDGVCDRLARIRLDTGDLAGALEVTTRWIGRFPDNERGWQRLIQIHLVQGDRSAALHAYDRCREALQRQLDAEPSVETQRLADRARLPLTADEPMRPPAGGPPWREDILVGRAGELESLVAVFRRAAGGPRTALVEGEAGIGKTRLAHGFLRWAEANGADVLRGRAFGTDGQIPYGTLTDALRQRMERERAPDDLLADIWLAELSRLLPELRDRYPDLPLPLADEAAIRPRLFEAVSRFFAALAERAPLVLFLDDVQWADDDTLDALQYAMRQLADGRLPALLLLTLRSEERHPTLDRHLAQLEREHAGTRLLLPALSREDIVLLLRSLAAVEAREAARAADYLFAETAGQPLFLIETVKSLIERGVWTLHPDGSIDFGADDARSAEPLPSSVREVILGRLAGLTPVDRSLLVAAAVLGHHVSFAELCAVAHLDEDAGLAALDAVTRARLLLATAGERYLFSHDRIRDVVYEDAGAARRRVFHRRALDVLQAGGAPAGRLAHHALAAGETEAAFTLCLAAGNEALRVSAIREAVQYYEQALGLVTTGSQQIPPLLYGNLGRAYELASDFSRAAEMYESMLSEAEAAGNDIAACSALNRLAVLRASTNPHSDAPMLLQRAMAIAERSGDRASMVETEWNLAQTSYFANDVLASLRHGKRALALARELGQPEMIARCLSTLGHASLGASRLEVVLEQAAEARDRYAALGDRVMEADSLRLLGHCRIRLGCAAEGVNLLRRARAMTEQIENVWGVFAADMLLALGLLDLGENEAAREAAQRSVAAVRQHGAAPFLVFALVALGGAHRALGECEAAIAAHREALTVGRDLIIPYFVELAAGELCADVGAAGGWDEASCFADLAVRHRDYQASSFMGTIPQYWITAALARAGETERADQDLERFRHQYGDRPRYRVPYLMGKSAVLAATGRPEEATARLEEARALAETMQLPNEIRRIDGLLASCLQEDDA